MLKYQQGDVLLYEVETVPAMGNPRMDKRGTVLAEGEATGHAHVMDAQKTDLVDVGDKTYLVVKGNRPVALRHEEHHAQTIAPGKYEVKIVREVDPFSEEVRSVAD